MSPAENWERLELVDGDGEVVEHIIECADWVITPSSMEPAK